MATTIPRLTDATTVNAADELIIQQGGITKRATASELAAGVNNVSGVFNVKSFGALGNGTTNDLAAFQAAIAAAAGKTVYVPSGTYLISFATTTALGLSNNTRIKGDGAASTTLVFQGSESFWRAISGGENCFLCDFTIKLEPATGQEGIAVRWQNNNLSLSNIFIIGGAEAAGGAFSKTGHGIQFAGSPASFSGLSVNKCKFSQCAFPFLKSNSTTSINSNIAIDGCTFTNNFREDVSLNGPNGNISNVTITNNLFDSNVGLVAGLDAIAIALANCDNYSVIGNVVRGSYRDGIHLEEGADNGTISNNVLIFDIANNGGGISLLEANQEGLPSATLNRNITISSNVITHTGTAKATNRIGIWCIYNSSPTKPVQNVSITNNICNNVQYAYIVDVGASSSVTLRNNRASNCFQAARIYGSYVPVSGMDAIDCDTYITAADGGSFLLPNYADDAAAATGGIPIGGQYRDGSITKVRVA